MATYNPVKDESLDYAKYPTLFAQVPQGVIPFLEGIGAAELLAELDKPEQEQNHSLLAAAFTWGLGLPRNDEQAIRHWQLAAEQGDQRIRFLRAALLNLSEEQEGTSSAAILSGTWLDNLDYSIDSEEQLRLSGKGIVIGKTVNQEPPWKGSAVRSAVIEEGITGLALGAFDGCESLESITLPQTLKKLDPGCFNKTGIRELYIPDSVIEINFLGQMPALTKISVPGGIKLFKPLLYADHRPGAVVDVHFRGDPPQGAHPSALGSGKIRAFYPAYNLNWTQEARKHFLGDITWEAEETAPEFAGVTLLSEKWGDNLLYSIDSSKTVHISGSGSVIGWINNGEIIRAPWRRPELISAVESVVIDDGITDLSIQAFAGCEVLKSIQLPHTLESLHLDCFDGTGIKELYIPASVREIQYLGDLPALQTISIPSGVTLSALTADTPGRTIDIYFRGNPPAINAVKGKKFLSYGKVKAHYPASNPKWTPQVLGQFQGNITWIPH